MVDKRGPIFNGQAERAVADACNDLEKRIATLGASQVRSELDHVLRKQTPYYRLRVVAESTPPGWTIHDQRVIYGPWLEGTGSRNRTTRFKGYATFRRMTQVIQRRANEIADSVIVKYTGRMQ